MNSKFRYWFKIYEGTTHEPIHTHTHASAHNEIQMNHSLKINVRESNTAFEQE